MDFKKQSTKELLEKHLLYFIKILDEQYEEAIQSGDSYRIRELGNKIEYCMFELELLGI